MVKYFTAALLFSSSALSAQTFPKPPDVTAYVAVTPQYEAGMVTANLPIDANVTPPTQAGLTDIPTSQTGRVIAGTTQCITLGETGGTCQEAKFRTLANATGIRYDDPIRSYGKPGQSHCHTFFGNKNANAYSTYARLRTNNNSFAAGAELNATGYWFPCVKIENAFGNGKNYAVKPEVVILYYNGKPSLTNRYARTPNGLRYIFGVDMDDPDRTWLQTIVNNANAQSGTAGRYSMPADNGFAWSCVGATPSTVGWLKNANGTDPFNGTCVSGATFYVLFQGANCWDGVNLWSPGGYKHVIPKINDSVTGVPVCPKNYYEIPYMSAEILFDQRGFSDYGRWRLVSDDHAAVAAKRPFKNGESFHTDWMDGWDQLTKRTWENECIGILNQVSRECNASAISNTQTLITSNAAPNGRSPQTLTEDFPTNVASKMWRLPKNANGPDTLHVHGN